MRTIPLSKMKCGNKTHARERIQSSFSSLLLFFYRSLPNTQITEYSLEGATTTTIALDCFTSCSLLSVSLSHFFFFRFGFGSLLMHAHINAMNLFLSFHHFIGFSQLIDECIGSFWQQQIALIRIYIHAHIQNHLLKTHHRLFHLISHADSIFFSRSIDRKQMENWTTFFLNPLILNAKRLQNIRSDFFSFWIISSKNWNNCLKSTKCSYKSLAKCGVILTLNVLNNFDSSQKRLDNLIRHRFDIYTKYLCCGIFKTSKN